MPESKWKCDYIKISGFFFPFAKKSTTTCQPMAVSQSISTPQSLIPTIISTPTEIYDQHVLEDTSSISVNIASSNHNSPLPSDPSPNITSVQTNTHNTQTRSKFVIFKPKVFSVTKEPSTIKEALQLEHWRIAIRDEYMGLKRNCTWFLVLLSPNKQPIGCKWVFKVKENADGAVQKHKARVVVRDFIKLLGLISMKPPARLLNPQPYRLFLLLPLQMNGQWDNWTLTMPF